jgi:hypothetical protein
MPNSPTADSISGGDCEQMVRFYDCEGGRNRAIIMPESQYYREKMTCRDAFSGAGLENIGSRLIITFMLLARVD